MILWSQEMTWRVLIAWKSTWKSIFRPKNLDPWSLLRHWGGQVQDEYSSIIEEVCTWLAFGGWDVRMQEYWFSNGCEYETVTRSGRASWECWEAQEIGVETELLNSNQTGYHICNQRSESIFVSTEDYPLGGGNEKFEVSEESIRERASLFRSGIQSSSRVLRCRLGKVSFW